MSTPIISNSIRELLWRTLTDIWANAYTEWPAEWSQIFDEKTGEGPYIQNTGMAGLGYARTKAESAGVAFDDMGTTFTAQFNPLVWALGYQISREAFEDHKYEEVGLKKTTALMRSMMQTKEVNHALILDRAFNSSYPTADTKEMCATDHKLYYGGTFRNELSVAADLSEAALEQACIDISNFVDDRSFKIKVMPKLLITSSSDVFNSNRILKNVDRPATADRDINALVKTNMIPNMMVNHYVTDTDAWFIKTDCPEGLCTYSIRDLEFSQENDWDTENFRAKATERYAPGITDVRGIYGSPGAA